MLREFLGVDELPISLDIHFDILAKFNFGKIVLFPTLTSDENTNFPSSMD